MTGLCYSYCDHKSCLNRDVSIASLLNWKKIESHFETWSSDAQRINLTFAAYSFVANFVRYISAKYYLNCCTFHTVIMKVLGVNFFLKHSVFYALVYLQCVVICWFWLGLLSFKTSKQLHTLYPIESLLNEVCWHLICMHIICFNWTLLMSAVLFACSW